MTVPLNTCPYMMSVPLNTCPYMTNVPSLQLVLDVKSTNWFTKKSNFDILTGGPLIAGLTMVLPLKDTTKDKHPSLDVSFILR